jgi:hypothetical protein
VSDQSSPDRDRQYIQRRGHMWRVVFPPKILSERYLGSFETLNEAIAARDRYLAVVGIDRPDLVGLTNQDLGQLQTADEVWSAAFRAQDLTEKVLTRQLNQQVVVPQAHLPFALAYLSDLHFGNPGTDYRAARHDAETIRDTERMWAGYHGDGIDNWIRGKLTGLQRGQAVPFDAEVRLFVSWLDILGDKLLWVVCGNHDNWTQQLAGLDRVHTALTHTRVLYDRNEILFTLVYGRHRWRIKVRHKWKYGSVFNVTHAIEVGWERGGAAFDIGLGGHTHTGTVDRPFFRQGIERHAVLTGTYKVHGQYAKELGLPAPMHRGCGAHVFWPDGRMLFCNDLETARDVLAVLLGEFV